MQILLTGASGFLGRTVAKRLIERGHAVRALQRHGDSALSALGVEQRVGDVASIDSVEDAARGCEAIVHCAAHVAEVGRLEAFYDANVRGTDSVIAACELAHVRKLVFASCASVVQGGSDLAGVDESVRLPTHWRAAYPHTKALAEQRVRAANGASLATVALRPALLWGPGEPHFMPRLLAAAQSGRLRLFGEPEKKIDTTHVDNAADAFALAVERIDIGAPIAGKAYFISQGEPTTVETFVNALLRAGGFPAETRRLGPAMTATLASSAEARHALLGGERAPLVNPQSLAQFGFAAWFDITAARRDLGYAPRVSTAEGVTRLSEQLARARMQKRGA